MNPENTLRLFSAFPYLYRGRSKSVHESSMSYGFQCGDGWFDLVWSLSQAIEDTARKDGLDPQSDAWPEATQVKEKFGTLRFHLRERNEATMALAESALVASQGICEECGQPGSPTANSRSPSKTLCPMHAEDLLGKHSYASRTSILDSSRN